MELEPVGRSVLLGALLGAGCFNPDLDASETGTGGTASSSTASTDETGPGNNGSSTTESVDTGSDGADDTTEGTGDEVPDWGEGEPPDFGDLGPEGDGDILVVHVLDLDDAVDVWLVGESSPVSTNIGPGEAVRLEDIPRDARRVVLARAGTTEAVGCSEWFPLRADEQWAIVAARDLHTCPSPTPDGASLTFEQDLPLDSNPVRFAHAGVADDITVIRQDVPEPGTLEPLATLSGTDLPDCGAAGCIVPYALENEALGASHAYTFAATQVADVPPPGEVLMVVLGNLRQDWPTQPDAPQILRVDIDGTVRPIRTDPELGVLSLGDADVIEFSLPAMPTSFTFAVAEPCFAPSCPVPTHRFIPGDYDITSRDPTDPGIGTTGTFTLEGGHRYLLIHTELGESALTLVDDTFDRSDDMLAIGRAFNDVSPPTTLSVGHAFGGSAVELWAGIPSIGVSDEQEVPVGGWDLLIATGGNPLGIDCFYGVDTLAGWRGLVGDGFLINLDTWPATQTFQVQLCF
ncbi:MAG: hypothetical protein AAF799_48005 [Myxococcota bacterium]